VEYLHYIPIGKATLLCPLWANGIAHFGHKMIDPCKVLVQGAKLSGLSSL